MRFAKDFRAAIVCAGVLTVTSFVASGSTLPHLAGGIHPILAANIYSDTANAREEIRQALLTAEAEHKRVLLDFGGNWCEDCQLLNIFFHQPGNASLLARNYVLVDVNVGQYDKNLDLARKYGIPLNKGVPALVVLNGAGQVVYAQRHGEFEAMRQLNSAIVTAFLEKWKPPTRSHRRHG